MHVVRGSVSDANHDRNVTRELIDVVESTEEPVVRVWTPPKQIAFGRRDTTADGYDRARQIAIEGGYEPIEREVGGSAVAYTGETIAFAYGVPTESERGNIDDRYRNAETLLLQALGQAGAAVEKGEPDASFCPGDHSVQGDGKIAGIAQRVRRESALVGGYVIVTEADERAVSEVLDPIYAALEMPFDPQSVGCVERVGGPKDADSVVSAIEKAFLGGEPTTVLSASELLATEATPESVGASTDENPY